MKYFNLNDVRFGVTIALCIAAMVILISAVKMRGKGWFVGFVVLSQITYAGYYIPSLLFRAELISSETYRKVMDSLNIVFSVSGMLSWGLLLACVVSLKSVFQAGTALPGADEGAMPPPLPDSPHKGYGGWLALFVAVQLWVQPIVTVVMLIMGVAALSEASARYPGFVILYSLQAAGSIALVGLGMHAALQLRHIRRGAVRAARRYLLAALAWAAISCTFPFMGKIPDAAREAMIMTNARGFLMTLIAFTVWFSYFHVSKRVKATYID